MRIFNLKTITTRIDAYLADPRIDHELLIRKRWAWIWLVVTCIGTISSAVFWLVILELWPLWLNIIIFLFGYVVAFSLYNRIRRFDIIVNLLFSYFILVVFVGYFQLGGLTYSLGTVLIGINCVVGSVLVGKIRWTIGMFVLYSLTIIIGGIYEPFLEIPDYITPEKHTVSFVILAVWITACLLFLMILFMLDQSRFEKSKAEKLRKIDEAKTLFFSNISHEFRTPLTIINGMAEQMEQNPERWKQTGPEKIKAQSAILLNLVNQLLDISKIEAEGMHLDLIRGDMQRFVQYITASFHSLAENNDIDLVFEKEADPLITDYDPEKLMQVLANIISNALKFTKCGGCIWVRVYKTCDNPPETLEISIRDNGKGIPRNSLDKIFNRFYQVHDDILQTPGTGLGLALSKELVRLMDGEILVFSEEGAGAEFIVRLPVSRNARHEKDNGISKIYTGKTHPGISGRLNKDFVNDLHPAADSENPLLLIVEDNKDVIEYLVAILEDQYLIELAFNGKEGLEKARDIIPDIILTDVMMPQMDGFDLLKNLREDIHTDHIPVVILTARGDFQSKLDGLEIGADHYLVKPINEKELFIKLNNLLETRRKMQEKLIAVATDIQPSNYQYKQEMLFISRLNNLIENYLDHEGFGIKEVCNELHISRPQLYRKFNALTNKTVGRYIRSYKLARAKQFIQNHGMNVSEAAIATGFKNLSHFSTSFREEFGFPPSEL